MTTGFATLTEKQAKQEIREFRETVRKIGATKESAREFLIKHGLLTKSGRLPAKYR